MEPIQFGLHRTQRPKELGQKADDYMPNGMASGSRQANDALVPRQTVEIIQELQKRLDAPKGHLHATIQLLKWPLRECEMRGQLTRLENVKTIFILSLVTGEMHQSQKTASKILSLRTLLEDVSIRQQAADSRKCLLSCLVLKLNEMGHEHQAMMEWMDPSITRKNIRKSRMLGTGV